MCNVTKEPEDVTVGFVVGKHSFVIRGFSQLCNVCTGIILGLDLNHTLLIHSHGNDLQGVDSDTLRYQAKLAIHVESYIVASHLLVASCGNHNGHPFNNFNMFHHTCVHRCRLGYRMVLGVSSGAVNQTSSLFLTTSSL